MWEALGDTTEDYLSLPHVDPSVFELAVCYMYGKAYKDHFSCTNPMPKKSEATAAAFRRHCLVYCFARNFELDGLAALATKNIKDLGQVDYRSVFVAAREAYKQLPDEESWFRDCFKVETTRALRDDHDLVRKTWLLDTFQEESGNFTIDLFLALTKGYEKIISKAVATASGSESSAKILRWFSPNLGHADYADSASTRSTDWTEGYTDSEVDSATGETSDDEIVHVEESSCVECRTPDMDPQCVAETSTEAEPTYLIEDAVAAEPIHVVEAAIPEEAQCYQNEPLPGEIEMVPAEKAVDIDEIPAPAAELEILSDESPPEQADEWATGGVWPACWSKKDKKNRTVRGLFGLEEVSAEPSLEPDVAAEESIFVEAVFVPAEEMPAEEIPAEKAPKDKAPVEDPSINDYATIIELEVCETSAGPIEIFDFVADAPTEGTCTVRQDILIPYSVTKQSQKHPQTRLPKLRLR